MAHAKPAPLALFKRYGLILLKKMACVAVAWVVVYFISQPLRKDTELNILMLFAPLLGAFAGLVAGWFIATDAAEDSGMSGLFLWVLLVAAAVLPMWAVEEIMHLILRWPMNFGGFMVLTAASVMALAAAVWHEASQE